MKQKTRIVEVVDGYGNSTFHPQEGYLFNLLFYPLQDYKVDSFGHRCYFNVICESYDEAINALRKNKKLEEIIHKGI